MEEQIMLDASDARMLKMAGRMWAPLVVMGLLIVVTSLVIGTYNSTVVADYFSSSKAARDAAEPGSTLVAQRVFSETTVAWLPGFKFFGMGLIFMGIVAALAVIILTLKNGGINIQKSVGAEVKTPPKPTVARIFPMLGLLGLIILAVTFGISIWQATIASSYWNNSIANTLDPAKSGVLLNQLSLMHSLEAWSTPLKFVGIATLLTSISFALFTIQGILRNQTMRLSELIKQKMKGAA